MVFIEEKLSSTTASIRRDTATQDHNNILEADEFRPVATWHRQQNIFCLLIEVQFEFSSIRHCTLFK